MTGNIEQKFQEERSARIHEFSRDLEYRRESRNWVESAMRKGYVYNFDWLGRPIIQYPQDVLALQEIIWRVKPDLVIETGVAHGGSLVLSASMLSLLDINDAIESNLTIDPKQSKRLALGIDIDIRAHNRAAINAHPMATRIKLIEGSSISPDVISQVQEIASKFTRVLVCLDSNHTHDHVLAELEAYAPLTSIGSYCVVLDTFVEDMPADLFPDRPWGPGNNPKTAVMEYLKSHTEFEIDTSIEMRLLITSAPGGYLKRVC